MSGAEIWKFVLTHLMNDPLYASAMYDSTNVLNALFSSNNRDMNFCQSVRDVFCIISHLLPFNNTCTYIFYSVVANVVTGLLSKWLHVWSSNIVNSIYVPIIIRNWVVFLSVNSTACKPYKPTLGLY